MCVVAGCLRNLRWSLFVLCVVFVVFCILLVSVNCFLLFAG